MPVAPIDLWKLVWNHRHLDPDQLAASIEQQAAQSQSLDFRTRLLIRDSARALEQHWGQQKVLAWVNASPYRRQLDNIMRSAMGESGFPSLASRIMESVDSEKVLEYLRTLGLRTLHPTRLPIGGSIALLLAGALARPTEDIDIVDEIPSELRLQHELLNSLAQRFGLQLTHFQSHYLPTGWETRLRSLGAFGQLNVLLVDTTDIFLSKLFSNRDKDIDDLRELKQQLNRDRLTSRLLDTCTPLLAQPQLKKNAADNWYILFGLPLPERSPA